MHVTVLTQLVMRDVQHHDCYFEYLRLSGNAGSVLDQVGIC